MTPATDQCPLGARQVHWLRAKIHHAAVSYFADAAAGNTPRADAERRLFELAHRCAARHRLGPGVADWAAASEWQHLKRAPEAIALGIRRAIAPLIARRAPGAAVMYAAQIAVARVHAEVPGATILACCRSAAAEILRHG